MPKPEAAYAHLHIQMHQALDTIANESGVKEPNAMYSSTYTQENAGVMRASEIKKT